LQPFINSSGRSAARRWREGAISYLIYEIEMRFVVYILFSEKLGKYYVGQTENIEKRLNDHNSGMSKFTSTGIPWKLIHLFEYFDRSEAIKAERAIKRRGIKRYLQDRNLL